MSTFTSLIIHKIDPHCNGKRDSGNFLTSFRVIPHTSTLSRWSSL